MIRIKKNRDFENLLFERKVVISNKVAQILLLVNIPQIYQINIIYI